MIGRVTRWLPRRTPREPHAFRCIDCGRAPAFPETTRNGRGGVVVFRAFLDARS